MRLLLTLALLVACGACAAVRGGDTPVTIRLAPMIAAPLGSIASGSMVSGPMASGSIAVAPVLARGLAGDRRYTYVEAAAPGVLRQAATFFWEEAPPRVLERALAEALGRRYPQVYAGGITLPADRRLTATLIHFEEIGAGAAPEALVGFDAVVTRAGRIERRGTHCGRAPVTDASGTGRARAFEAALSIAVGAFVQGVPGSPC